MTPVDWAAVGTAITVIWGVVVKVIIPGMRALQAPAHSGSNGTKALEARIAGGESATLLAATQENRRIIDAVFETVGALARTTERSAELLEQVTALAVKSDDRWQAVTESTEAMSRMLQLHTGLLDKTALQIDALHAALPKKKRGKR